MEETRVEKRYLIIPEDDSGNNEDDDDDDFDFVRYYTSFPGDMIMITYP